MEGLDKQMTARSMQYRLDADSESLLNAALLHLIVRGEEVIGRYGRGGHVTGRMQNRMLTATFSESARQGELVATFDDNLAAFRGSIRFANGDDQERTISGTRVTR